MRTREVGDAVGGVGDGWGAMCGDAVDFDAGGARV